MFFFLKIFVISNLGIGDVKSITDPLEKVQAGLRSNSGAPVPLKAVHVRAKILDLAAQVGCLIE